MRENLRRYLLFFFTSVFSFILFAVFLTCCAMSPAYAEDVESMPEPEPVYDNQQLDYTDKLNEVLQQLSSISDALNNLPSVSSEGQELESNDYSESFNEVLHALSDIANTLEDISAATSAGVSDPEGLDPDPEPTEYQRELLNYIIDITNRLELLAPEPADPEQQAIADQEQKEQLEKEAEERQEFMEILSSIRDSLEILSAPVAQDIEQVEEVSEDATHVDADVPQDQDTATLDGSSGDGSGTDEQDIISGDSAASDPDSEAEAAPEAVGQESEPELDYEPVTLDTIHSDIVLLVISLWLCSGVLVGVFLGFKIFRGDKS